MALDIKMHKKAGICIEYVAYCSEYVRMNIIKPGKNSFESIKDRTPGRAKQ